MLTSLHKRCLQQQAVKLFGTPPLVRAYQSAQNRCYLHRRVLRSRANGQKLFARAASPEGVAEIETKPPYNSYVTHSWMWKGHRIKYVVAGCGEPVVLVHGFGASIGHFRKNIPELAKTNKVFALDLLGFGASEKPLLDYSIELWADLVVDFMREFVQAPAVLVGNSLGSLIALTAAAIAPAGSVRGLALLNCAGGMNNKAIADDWRIQLALPIFLLIDYLLKQEFLAKYLFDKFRSKENVRNVLQNVYRNPAAVDDELVDIIYNPSCDEGALEAFVSIITGPPGPRPEALMPKISGPLLLLWGDADPFTPHDGPVGRYFQSLPAVRANTKFVLMPGVGHCPHDDFPDDVNAYLTEFISTA